MDKDDILTKTQVQEYLKISRGSLSRLMTSGEIPYFKLARRVLFRKADVDAWLETKRVKASGRPLQGARTTPQRQTRRPLPTLPGQSPQKWR
jgi:excisionase family DNA binding protein